MITGTPLQKAVAAYRPVFYVLMAFAAVTLVQSIYLGVPLSDFSDVKPMALVAIIKFIIFMFILTVFSFCSVRFSIVAFKKKFSSYLESDAFCFGVLGAFILISCSILFIIQKCFVAYLNPFGFWDPLFMEWDRALHGGQFPQDYMMRAVDRMPWIAKMLDIVYMLWFLVLYLTGAYCLYCDRNFRRRMHFMWAYIFTFLLVGSFSAIALSSVGPVFYGDFLPDLDNPYVPLVQHLAEMDRLMGLQFVSERHWLLKWTTDSQFIDLNSISAMPSMHNATMLFAAIYLKNVNKIAFGTVAVMAVLVYFASVYCGFHYALDAYVGYAIVLAIWPLTGWLIKRLYPDTENMVLTR